MTLERIVVEAYEALGEPSDLSPYGATYGTIDTTSAGWARFVRIVNEAALALAMWKWPNGRQIRYRFTEDVTFMRSNSITGTLSSVSGGSVVMSGLLGGQNLYVGRYVVGGTSGATGLVLWSHDTSLLLTKVTGTFVNGETARMYQREFAFTAVTDGYDPEVVYGIPYLVERGAPIDVIQVLDLAADTILDETVRTDRFMETPTTVGIPSAMYRVPKGFVLDVWPAEDRDYAVRYHRGPKVLTINDKDVEPELPAQFHWGLVLYVMWWGLRRAQESNDAYATKKDLEDFMARTRTEFDLQDEIVNGQIKIYPQGR